MVGIVVPRGMMPASVVAADVVPAADIVMGAEAEDREQELADDQGAADGGAAQIDGFHASPRLLEVASYQAIRPRWAFSRPKWMWIRGVGLD